MLKIFYLRPQKKVLQHSPNERQVQISAPARVLAETFRTSERGRKQDVFRWLSLHGATYIVNGHKMYLLFRFRLAQRTVQTHVSTSPCKSSTPPVDNEAICWLVLFSLMSRRHLPLLNTNTPLWGLITNPTSTSMKPKAISLAHVIGERRPSNHKFSCSYDDSGAKWHQQCDMASPSSEMFWLCFCKKVITLRFPLSCLNMHLKFAVKVGGKVADQ